MNKILFKHELNSTRVFPTSKIIVYDTNINNVQVNDNNYTIDNNSIEKIKELLNNPLLYEKHNVLFPPILDGASHSIVFSSDKTINVNCSNLWYWLDEKAFDNYEKTVDKKDIEYTKLVIKIISNIENILHDNNINIHILGNKE